MDTREQKRPADVIARECLAVRVRKLNRAVTKIYEDALRPLGITTSQLNILVVVAKLGLARPADICQRLALNASTLSRNVERMIARGWLEVVADDDGRAQPLRLKMPGQRMLRQAEPAWQRAQQLVQQRIGEDAIGAIELAAQQISSRHPSFFLSQ